MATHIARYAKLDTVAAAATGHLTLLTDQSRDAVFLKGRVRCGPAFAKAMLVLGQIVRMAARVYPCRSLPVRVNEEEWIQ